MKHLVFLVALLALNSACTVKTDASGKATEVSCDTLESRTSTLNSNVSNKSYSTSAFVAECNFIQRQNGLKCDDVHSFDFFIPYSSCESWGSSRASLYGIYETSTVVTTPVAPVSSVPKSYTASDFIKDIPTEHLKFYFEDFSMLRQVDILNHADKQLIDGVPTTFSYYPNYSVNLGCSTIIGSNLSHTFAPGNGYNPSTLIQDSKEKAELLTIFDVNGQTLTLSCSRFSGTDNIRVSELKAALGSSVQVWIFN